MEQVEEVTRQMSLNEDEEDPLDAYMRSLGASNDTEMGNSDERPFQRAWRMQNAPSSRTKNRRYQKLQELLYSSNYFSDESMELRNPGLFHLHLGNYLPEKPVTRPTAEQSKLSSFLIASIQKKDAEERKAQEESSWGSSFRPKRKAPPVEKAYDDEFEEEIDEEDEDEEEKEDDSMSDSSSEEFTLDERRAHLIDVMSQRFLQGLDFEFVDYADIDGNTLLDNSKMEQQDAEDRYFDTE
ncbi:hypothetical protein AC1031_015430 [Aphanomyces cochlioides]|nr:hypothetical protein AC1031_015430 [Aphanomyces cochlioides]